MTDEATKNINAEADETLRGVYHRFVRIVGENRVGLASDGDEDVVGVNDLAPEYPGASIRVSISGVIGMETEGPVSAGDWIGAGKEGRAKTTENNSERLGIALTSAAPQKAVRVLLKL